ncbi:MAG: bifunctional folylpolyglutamate synthase/dihydrofolate synthase [bacterium]
MTPSNALDYIYDLQRIGIKFGLTNTELILNALGNPHQNFKGIHIGGTNGKGSTAAMLASILKAAGYKVGLYTSPHLIHLSERIQINGYPISETDLTKGAEELKLIIRDINFKDSHPTFFETVTCLAFSYFSRMGVDWAVIEVGMGGRWDATNVCNPSVAVITNISMDHQEYLGQTLVEIAGEKAGLIKPGCPLVTAVTQEEVLAVIRKKCESEGAPIYLVPELYSYEYAQGRDKPFLKTNPLIDGPAGGQQINIKRAGLPYITITQPLMGGFQIQNTFLVLEVIRRLREMHTKIDDEAVKKGLLETIWPGRIQIVSRRPYMVLDGAHNPSAAQKMAETVRTHFSFENLILVLGILKDKDIAGICREILPLAHYIILSSPESDRAATAQELYQIIQNNGLAGKQDIIIVPRLSEAIIKAKASAGEKDLILVTGSLYTIGEVMSLLGIKPFQPEVKKAVTNTI